MIIHDEAYETRHDSSLSPVLTFCGINPDEPEEFCVLYVNGKKLRSQRYLTIDCEACILIKFQIDSTK